MIFLSDAAIRYAVDVCQERKGYTVGIAIQNPEGRDIVCKKILSMISDSDCITKIKNLKHDFAIWFDNGSMIRCIAASESSRTMAFHLVIASWDIPIDIMDNVLKPIEKTEWIEYRKEHRKI